MNDPMNKLRIDPEWIKKVQAVTDTAAKELDCMVMLVAIQPNGKLMLDFSGTPEYGPLREFMEDPPAFIRTLAMICELQDFIHKGNPQ